MRSGSGCWPPFGPTWTRPIGWALRRAIAGWVGNFGWESWEPLRRWLLSPQDPDLRGAGFMAGGLGFVFLLYSLRTRLLWFPLHPSGYVLSGGAWGGMIYFWFPVMVAWLLKTIVLRLGGLPTYRRTQPFFLGLVLGDFVPRSVLSVLSFILNLYMPSAGAGHTL
ncbi:MAG: hypothetical protein KatS3mg115_1230 [Candidatus Poribacteria bacterium]|nr:MAG: hypothetical protein KatS3mg115_1230 [Candidatus Poribacteria bacterium]